MLGRLKSWDTLAILFLALWHFIYYLPASLGQKVFSEDDIFLFFIPFHTELTRALAEGRLPLWTPYIQGGFPLFAEGQVEALYPLNLLLHLLFPVPLALSYLILLDLSLISVGMYLLARSYGLRVGGALLAGFVVGSCGFEIAHLPHIPLLTAAALLPWLLWACQKYFDSRSNYRSAAIWFSLLVILVALNFLAGFPQFAVFNIAAFTVVALAHPFLAQPDPVNSTRTGTPHGLVQVLASVKLVVPVIVLGTGIGAIQWLPTAELVDLSIRGQPMGNEFFTSYSFEPHYLYEFLLPFSQLQHPEPGNMEYWSYLGIIPLVLALVAPFLRRDARTWFYFAFGVLALSLTFGDSNPLYTWLYYLPVVNRFRVPSRYLFLFSFAFAYLAGVGFQQVQDYLKRDVEPSHWVERIGGGVISLLGVAVIWLSYVLPQPAWMEAWGWLPILLGSIAFGMFGLARLNRINQVWFTLLALGFTMLDLALFASPFHGSIARMDVGAELVTPPRTLQALDSEQPIFRVLGNYRVPVTRPSIRAGLLWNFPLQFAREGVLTYLPTLALERNAEYVANMTVRMRDLMNIRYYVLPLQNQPEADTQLLLDEPVGGLATSMLSNENLIPPTSTSRIQIVSYTDQTTDLPDGYLAGEIVLKSSEGLEKRLPIRLGIETAGWADEEIGKTIKVAHARPSNAIMFPAFLNSVGHEFLGQKYVAEYDLGQTQPLDIVQLSVRTSLSSGSLNIERILFLDGAGKSVSLTQLLNLDDLELKYRTQTAMVWENLNALPRAYMIYNAEVIPDAQMLDRVASLDFDPSETVLLGDNPPPQFDGKQGNGRVVIKDYEASRVVMEAVTDKTGYLLFTDTWYPGWAVWVDGNKMPIYRADYIFRAVEIEPGTHHVEFEFHSESFAWGLGISLFCCASLGILTIFGRRWL